MSSGRDDRSPRRVDPTMAHHVLFMNRAGEQNDGTWRESARGILMDQDLIQLQDHLAVLRRRWRLVALCMVIAIGLGLAWSFSQTKMYRGTASLLLEPQETVQNNSGVVMDPEEVATQADV